MLITLKNNNKGRDLLLKALIIYSLLISIISYSNIVSKSILLLMPTLNILLIAISVF
jgi:hypothetical protein